MNVKYIVRVLFLGRHPALFSAYHRLLSGHSQLVVTPDSELVIEGYPRSANTFAVLAFERAQSRPVRLGHHLHAEAQIILAVNYSLPVLVLIREPIGAAASLITRDPSISVEQALTHYLSFYRCAKAHLSSVVLADFKTVTSDYARVIQVINARFRTHFQLYVNSPQEDQGVFDAIDRLSKSKGEQIHQLARPSTAKIKLLSDAFPRIEAHPLAERAKDFFSELSSHCI